jgi:hypothetical protein
MPRQGRLGEQRAFRPTADPKEGGSHPQTQLGKAGLPPRTAGAIVTQNASACIADRARHA